MEEPPLSTNLTMSTESSSILDENSTAIVGNETVLTTLEAPLTTIMSAVQNATEILIANVTTTVGTIASTLSYNTSVPSMASELQNLTMNIVQNVTTVATTTVLKSLGELSPTEMPQMSPYDQPQNDEMPTEYPTNLNYTNFFHESFSQNKTSGPNKYTTPMPGTSEIIIIVAIVCVLLWLAAKYIGCTLSHCPIISRCFKHSGNGSNYHVPISASSIGQDLSNYRQEYSRRDIHYAVYSRPSTAYPGGLMPDGGRTGFSFNSSFNPDEFNDNCKVVIGDEEDDGSPPPDYNSIVPSHALSQRSRKYYTYSASRR